jgi:hypothetical protein
MRSRYETRRRVLILGVFLCDEERRSEGISRGVAADDASDDNSHGLSFLYQLVRTVHVVRRGFVIRGSRQNSRELTIDKLRMPILECENGLFRELMLTIRAGSNYLTVEDMMGFVIRGSRQNSRELTIDKLRMPIIECENGLFRELMLTLRVVSNYLTVEDMMSRMLFGF